MNEKQLHTLLYGSDKTERIVGVFRSRYPEDEGAMVVVTRDEDGDVHYELDDNEWKWWVYLTQKGFDDFFTKQGAPLHPDVIESNGDSKLPCLRAPKFSRDVVNRFDIEPYKTHGKGPMKYIIKCRTHDEANAFNRWTKPRYKGNKAFDKKEKERVNNLIFTKPWAEENYLISSGRTLFKGMDFNDVKRMGLDLEVVTTEAFPNAFREGDEIVVCTLVLNQPSKVEKDRTVWALHTSPDLDHPDGLYCDGEKGLIEELVRIVKQEDPDVIEGHNVFNFDLRYIHDRCNFLGIYQDKWGKDDIRTKLPLGRDLHGDPDTSYYYDAMYKAADKMFDLRVTRLAGRHIIDTMIACHIYDSVARKMTSYGLKEAARFFGVNIEGREELGAYVSDLWYESPEQQYRVVDYAIDDVRETMAISEHLLGSTFYMTQMVPSTYEKIARTGSNAKIEAIFVREYLRRYQAMPIAQDGQQEHGGYTDVMKSGLFGPIVYADVSSLYPSIMVNYDIKPKSDDLEIFLPTLKKLTDLRFKWKNSRGDDKNSNEYKRFDGMQNAAKVVINSFYGIMGFRHAHWNDFESADAVALKGQELLGKIIELIFDDGGDVIEVDTDGVLCIPPEHIEGEDNEKEWVRSLTDKLDEDGILIDFDGRAEKMLSYRAKNYAMREYDGKVKFKGGSLISRSTEGFLRDLTQEIIKLLLDEDFEGIRNVYIRTYRDLMTRNIGVDALRKRVSMKKSLKEYEKEDRMLVQYEAGLVMRDKYGADIRRGDPVEYYVTGDDKRPKVSENFKVAREWENDANLYYYAERLKTTVDKFRMFFDDEDFDRIFGMDTGFFPPNMEGIQIQNKTIEDDDSKLSEDE